MRDNFEDYCDYLKYDYVLKHPKADISRGVLEREQIDDIKNHPEIDKIRIMGLKQDTFEYFVDKYGQQFKVIYFFKNKAVKDLSPLSSLEKVEFIGYFFNQGCSKLWDMSKNYSLRGLSINDFSKLHNLDDIPTAPNLEYLYFGNMVWVKLILETLQPLTNTRLKYLEFTAKKITDNDVTPIAQIKTLEELEFSTRLFSTEQIAWLTANLKGVKSSSIGPYHMYQHPIKCNNENGIKLLDTLIHGKGKPLLDSKNDCHRIEKYVREFDKMVAEFSKPT